MTFPWIRFTWPLLLLSTLATDAAAQNATPIDDPAVAALAARASVFFESVSEDKIQEAFATLLAGSQLAKGDRQEQLTLLMKKTRDLATNYGPYRNHERIAARRVGSDLVVLKYLYKCENYPVVWYIVYYRDQREPRGTEAASALDTWRVVTLRFDTDLEALAR
ncbi:MAG: hypothetical protein HYX69_22710 [Planctomycetia bacterium]|nr:hypothetical protein [Planctomycetia bacterium]